MMMQLERSVIKPMTKGLMEFMLTMKMKLSICTNPNSAPTITKNKEMEISGTSSDQGNGLQLKMVLLSC